MKYKKEIEYTFKIAITVKDIEKALGYPRYIAKELLEGVVQFEERELQKLSSFFEIELDELIKII